MAYVKMVNVRLYLLYYALTLLILCGAQLDLGVEDHKYFYFSSMPVWQV